MSILASISFHVEPPLEEGCNSFVDGKEIQRISELSSGAKLLDNQLFFCSLSELDYSPLENSFKIGSRDPE
jgi:hypothetical protein